MKNPLVGITSDIKGKFYEVESFYFTSLLKSGAIPVMLPMITNRKDTVSYTHLRAHET